MVYAKFKYSTDYNTIKNKMKSMNSSQMPYQDYLVTSLYQDKIRKLPKLYRSLQIPFSPPLSTRVLSPPISVRNRKSLGSMDHGKEFKKSKTYTENLNAGIQPTRRKKKTMPGTMPGI